MKKVNMKSFALKLALFLTPVQAAYASPPEDPELSIAFTFSMPPYLNLDKNSGVEHDIIIAAFNRAGVDKLKILNVHYLRAIELAKAGTVDAIVSNSANGIYLKKLPEIKKSQPTLSYVDCAISLRERNLKLESIKDYYDKRIWAFKSASLVFSPEFQLMTQKNTQYDEDVDQEKQLEMLAMGRIDIAISDRNIFTAKLGNTGKYTQEDFRFDSLGPTTQRAIRSNNADLITRFNKGLSTLHKSGEYQSLISTLKCIGPLVSNRRSTRQLNSAIYNPWATLQHFKTVRQTVKGFRRA